MRHTSGASFHKEMGDKKKKRGGLITETSSKNLIDEALEKRKRKYIILKSQSN